MSNVMPPEFPFPSPRGYGELLRRDLIGFTANTSRVDPWTYLPQAGIFDALEKWKTRNETNTDLNGQLIAFAARGDCDQLACFHVIQQQVVAVVRIEGWQNGNREFVVLGRYTDFWDWVRSLVSDLEDLSNLSP